MTKSNLFRADDHELWALVQTRIAKKLSWEEIAAEVGCEAMELVHWANDVYRGKKKRPDRPTHRVVYSEATREPPVWSPAANARRFVAWKRQHDGVVKTLAGRS